MNGILDRYIKSATSRAESFDDIFAIALARRLDDADAFESCRRLAAQYPHAVLADAMSRLRSRHFDCSVVALQEELIQQPFGDVGHFPVLMAVKIERKALAVAVLRGPRVVRTEVRSLAYSNTQAARAAAGLVGRLSVDHPDSMVVFDTAGNADTRRGRIQSAAIGAVRGQAIPLRELTADDFFDAVSIPSARTRESVRAVSRAVFCHVDGLESTELVDALMLGAVAYCEALLGARPAKDAPI